MVKQQYPVRRYVAKLPMHHDILWTALKGQDSEMHHSDGFRVARHLRQSGFKYYPTSEILGVDWGGGRKHQYREMRKRCYKASSKNSRLRILQKRAGKILHAARSIAVGAAAYGAKVMGMPCFLLRKLRNLVRSATPTKSAGASATIDLKLQNAARKLDPAHDLEPLLKWSRGIQRE